MPAHQIEGWGQIAATVAMATATSSEVFAVTGTVTADGVGCEDDGAGGVKCLIAGNHEIKGFFSNDCVMASGFGAFLCRLLVNGTPVSEDATMMANAEQLYSGAGGPERMQYNQSASVHVVVALAVNDIVTAEIERFADGNQPTGNALCTITVTRESA
jgi:hypothetical protein